MQLNKGLKKSKMNFMTTLKEEDIPSKMDVPKEIKNIRSPELQKMFLVRQKVDPMMQHLDKANTNKNKLFVIET